MTPDQARALLGADIAPGPWYEEEDDFGNILGNSFGHACSWGPQLRLEIQGCEPGDIPLIAAAPVLAAMIAGMREEWGVKWDDDPNGLPDWGFPTRAAAEQWEKKHRHRGPGRGRIVRRYVTEPEAADAVD